MKRICVSFLDPDLFFIPLGTLPWQPILGKICKVTYIQHANISQRIRIRNFAFEVIKGTIYSTFCAILLMIGPTNRKVLAGSFCTFWDETAKIDASYQISQQVLDQTSPTFQLW